jgi:hypothetical protein
MCSDKVSLVEFDSTDSKLTIVSTNNIFSPCPLLSSPHLSSFTEIEIIGL